MGVGLLSVAVLNVNNIRDMASDEGLRKTVPLRIGEHCARWYQTALIVIGVGCFIWSPIMFRYCGLTVPFFVWHIIGVWTRRGNRLDPMLPLLVISTFVIALLYGGVAFLFAFLCQVK